MGQRTHYRLALKYDIHSMVSIQNTSLVAPGEFVHRLQHRTACKIQNGRQGAPKWLPGGANMAAGVWVYPLVFERSRQLLKNLFLDPRFPSPRKVDDREKKKEKKREKNDVFSGH